MLGQPLIRASRRRALGGPVLAPLLAVLTLLPAEISAEVTSELTLGQAVELRGLASRGRFPATLLQRLDEDGFVSIFVGLDLDLPKLAAADLARPSEARAARASKIAVATDRLLNSVGGDGVEVVARFRSVRAVALRVSPGALVRLSANPMVREIAADAEGGIALLESRALVRADRVASELGIDGSGVTVAVLDSGIDRNHPDLADAIIAEECFCFPSCCPNGRSLQSGQGAAFDGHGHGTHVSGIVTANGSQAGPGVAPGASIAALRVLDEDGTFSSLSNIILAVEWVTDQGGLIDVINMSLGTRALATGACDDNDFSYSLLAQAINDATQAGIVVVAASGNDASSTRMSAPGCFSQSVAVGAVYDANVGSQGFGRICSDGTSAADRITCFSNRNADTDLLAPGAVVISARPGGGAVANSGTSMATPMVAGCAALIREALPNSTRDEVVGFLRDTGVSVPDQLSGRSYPRIDCRAAVAAALATATTTTTSTTLRPTTTSTRVRSSTSTLPVLLPICGDADGGGSVQSGDALAALRAAVGLDPACAPSRCDVNGSGSVTAADALAILRIAVGLEVDRACPL